MGLDESGQHLHSAAGAVGAARRAEAPDVQRGAKAPTGFTPRDEFDPEIFNRRYLTRRLAVSLAHANLAGCDRVEKQPVALQKLRQREHFVT